MKAPILISIVSLSLGACTMTEAPRVSANATGMTQYIWRGLPMTARPVAQGSITTDFEAKEGDRLKLTTWGSMSLTASNGDAAFTNSDFLDMDEMRVIADYSHAFDHRLLENFHAGVVSYTYSQSGQSSRELFAGTEWNWDRFVSEVLLYWDVDEKDGMYLNGSIKGGFDIDEDVPGYWKVALGFGTSNMNDYLYGDDDAGISDFTAEVGGTHVINKNTTVNAFAALSHLFTDDDFLDARSIETTNVWLGVGVAWGF